MKLRSVFFLMMALILVMLATALPASAASSIKICNRTTGLYIDGMGRTSNGSNAGQWSSGSSYNQQWSIVPSGNYVMIKNLASGLYLDGMGRTSNGSICGQWSYSGSANQLWVQETVGSYVKFRNVATGLYLDGMGSTSNGSNLCQWSSSSSYNQQWSIVTPPTPTPTVDGPVGFGKPTGGGSVTPITVTTSSAFADAIKGDTPAVILVQGRISSNGAVAGKNKTIKGTGYKPTLVDGLILSSSSSNIIIQDITFTSSNPSAGANGKDGLGITGGTNVWVDHCTFVDCADGSLDITKGADNVTVSWCKFYYTYDHGHDFPILIGADDADGNASDLFHVTIHHNWFGLYCDQRLPSNRNGWVHVFNNYYSSSGNLYCVRGRLNSQTLIANNVFEGVNKAWEYYVTSGTTAKIKAVGNLLINTATPSGGNDSVFTPPYTYSNVLDVASAVKSKVTAGAGSRK